MNNLIESGPANYMKAEVYTSYIQLRHNSRNFFITGKDSQAICISLKKQVNRFALLLSKVVFYFLLIISNISAIEAQRDISYALHANIIYRITKYISWPGYSNSGDFIIGIVGNTPLYHELADFITNKTVGNRKIIIKKMSPSANTYDCHILFISEDKSKSLKKIVEITRGYSILIITEASEQALNGSCINFVLINEHLKLEINKTSIEERNLGIATELLRLGTIVK